MTRKDEGMTILEVVMAVTILMMGVVFILKGDAVSYHYRAQQELHQQLVFFAAGCIEVALGIQDDKSALAKPPVPPNNIIVVNYDYPDYSPESEFQSRDNEIMDIPDELQDILIPFKVIVSAPNLPEFEMYNYRIAVRHED